MKRRLAMAGACAVAALGLTTGMNIQAAQASSYWYYYSGPANCEFDYTWGPNYTPVRLVVQVSGGYNRAFQYQFGAAAGGNNSEIIDQGHMHEYDGSWNPVGYWYATNFPATTSGTSDGEPTSYSPWLNAYGYGKAQVRLDNASGKECYVNFTFKAF